LLRLHFCKDLELGVLSNADLMRRMSRSMAHKALSEIFRPVFAAPRTAPKPCTSNCTSERPQQSVSGGGICHDIVRGTLRNSLLETASGIKFRTNAETTDKAGLRVLPKVATDEELHNLEERLRCGTHWVTLGAGGMPRPTADPCRLPTTEILYKLQHTCTNCCTPGDFSCRLFSQRRQLHPAIPPCSSSGGADAS
jgi:hypothetical protein